MHRYSALQCAIQSYNFWMQIYSKNVLSTGEAFALELIRSESSLKVPFSSTCIKTKPLAKHQLITSSVKKMIVINNWAERNWTPIWWAIARKYRVVIHTKARFERSLAPLERSVAPFKLQICHEGYVVRSTYVRVRHALVEGWLTQREVSRSQAHRRFAKIVGIELRSTQLFTSRP